MADNKLELVVEVDTRKANASIKSVNASLSSIEAAAVQSTRRASSGLDQMTVSVAKGAAAANLLTGAFERLAGAVRRQIDETVRLAARNEMLAVVNSQLARVNSYNAEAIERLVARIKALGITTQAARDTVNQMIAAQLDLSRATELARLAQDAAVVSGQNSSEALQGIINGIATQQIRVLRTYGIIVQFDREFQAARRKLGRDLTDIERANIALNAVLAQAPTIAGAYEAALSTVGKQITSLARYVEEAKAAVGEQFLPELRQLIRALTAAAEWVRENSRLIGLFAKALAGAAIGAAVAQFIGWMGAARSAITALTAAMSSNPITLIAVGAATAAVALREMHQATRRAVEGVQQLGMAEAQRRKILAAVESGRSADELKRMGYTADQVRAALSGSTQAAEQVAAAFDAAEFRRVVQQKVAVATSEQLAQRQSEQAEKLAREIARRRLEIERESEEAIEDVRRRGLRGFAAEFAEVAQRLRKWTTVIDDSGNAQRIDLTRRSWENVITELRERLASWQREFAEANRRNLAEYLEAEEEAARRRLEIEARVVGQRLAYDEEIARRNLDHMEQMLSIEEARAGITRDAQLRAIDATNAQTIEQKLAVEQRKAEIEIEHITRVHEIRMQLFDLETARMVMEEEAQLKRLGYRADEIQARIAELTAQRDEIRRFQQQATDAAIQAARENAAIRQAQLVRDHNQRIFESFKRQAEGVFDALLTKSQSIWAAIGNSLKTALLTAIKDVVTSRIAALLMQLFTGARVGLAGGGASGGGALARLGGLIGIGAVPVFGRGGGGGLIPGGAAGGMGTPPFIPTGGGGFGGAFGGLKDFLGFGGGVQYAPGKAVTWEAASLSQKLSALGRSNAALLGGATLAIMGLQRGGLSGLAMTTAGGAMIGFKYGGPIGAAIGAGIGAVAGIVRLFIKGAQEKAREKIKATYGVDIKEKNILAEIVNIAKQGFGGNLDAAIRSQQVRDLVELYALSTGQSTSGLPATMRPVSLIQQGGSLFQQSSGGLTLDRIGGGSPSSAAGPTIINITVPGAKEFFERETVRVVTDNPRAVQSAAMAATKASAGRREMTGLQLSPGLIMS